MKTKHFEIFEEKHLPPDWDALEDQLAAWVFNPTTLSFILKKHKEMGYPWGYRPPSDPELMLQTYTSHIIDIARYTDETNGFFNETQSGKVIKQLMEIGVNYEDDSGRGYSLVPVSHYDPLKLFYPVVTDKDPMSISLTLDFDLTYNPFLTFLSDDGLLGVMPFKRYSNFTVFESWSKEADAEDHEAFKACLAAWIVVAGQKTDLPHWAFRDRFDKPIHVPFWVIQEFKGPR